MADRPAGAVTAQVVVAVLTYRRLPGLMRLLPLLIAQASEAAPGMGASARVLVVDNDPDGSAFGAVQSFGPLVDYVHEARPGIAAGRARAVVEASDADVLVFIDDDEVPATGWLEAMVSTWLAHGRPAAVAGRVTAVCPPDLDPWIEAGGFFQRKTYPTGTAVGAASSANLLLDVAVLRETGVTFDTGLGLRGGEDTLLTRSLVDLGHRVIWCDEAEVMDLVPAERLTRSWVLRRAFSHGAVASRVALSLPDPPPRASLAARALGRILAGVAQAAWGVMTGRLSRRARGCRLVWRGAGMLTGALGGDVVEYSRARR